MPGLFRSPPRPQARSTRRTIGLHFTHTVYSATDNVGGTNKSISVAGVSWLAGDLVVVVAALRDATASITGCTVSGLSFAQQRAEDNATNLTATLYTAYAVSGGSGTIVITTSGAANLYAAEVVVINGVTPRVDALDSLVDNAAGFTIENPTQIANARIYAFLVFNEEGTFVNGQNAYNIPIRENEQLTSGTETIFRTTRFGDVGSTDIVGWPFEGTVDVANNFIAFTFAVSSTAVASLARTTADALGLSDVATRAVGFIRSTADALGLADVVTRAGTFLRTAADALTLSDVATRVGTFLRTTADALGLADAAVASKTFFRTVADSLSLSDSAMRTGTFLRTTTDAITHSDAAIRLVVLTRTATDSTTYSDVATRAVGAVRSTADSLGLSDAATRAVALVRSTADALGLSDAAVAIKEGAVTIGLAIAEFRLIQHALQLLQSAFAAVFSLPVIHHATMTTTALEYDLNDTVSPTCTFTVSNVNTDPTTISLTVREPDATTTTYTYAAAQITKTAVGIYTKDFTLAKRGVWLFQWAGTGSVQASAEGTVTVRN